MINELKKFYVEHGHTYVPSKAKEHQTLYRWIIKIRNAKSELESSLIEELDSIGFDWTPYNSFDQLWLFRFHQLQRFIKEHGHSKVPYNYKAIPQLGVWVHTQRRAELKNTISKERKEMLESVGFAWCSTIEAEKNNQWDKMYERLLAFEAVHGHPNVPANWSSDKQLARWVARQKEIRETIPPDRKEKLEALGFLWSLRDINWDKMFARLEEFYEEHQHSLVPHHYEGDTRLSEWVYRQRQYPGRLSREQREKLDSVDFMWRENMQKLPDKNWKKMYSKLKSFRNKNGHCKVPSKSRENPQLSSWVSRQRHSKNKLARWKIDKLNEIGFSWAEDIRKEKRKAWLNMYTRLKKFNAENGHCNVPSQYDADEKLGRWIETQRLYKTKMEQWKVDMLEKIGFKWSEDIQREKKLRWYKMYDKLKAFYARFGHSRVPEYWEEDPELSLWVIGQRRPKKPLSLERKNLLNELNFAWNNESPNRQRDEKGRYVSNISEKKKRKGR